MTAYTDATKIAAYLGVTLTGPQQTQAGVVAQAISDWIDRRIGRSWQATSPVTDELHQILGDRIYLARRPVVSITSLSTRQEIAGGAWTTLSASQYELLDAADGEVLISGWGGSLTKTTYTHSMTTAPNDIALAATILAADLMTATVHPESAGISQIAVGQNDISVKFADASAVPPGVSRALEMVDAYRTIVIA